MSKQNTDAENVKVEAVDENIAETKLSKDDLENLAKIVAERGDKNLQTGMKEAKDWVAKEIEDAKTELKNADEDRAKELNKRLDSLEILAKTSDHFSQDDVYASTVEYTLKKSEKNTWIDAANEGHEFDFEKYEKQELGVGSAPGRPSGTVPVWTQIKDTDQIANKARMIRIMKGDSSGVPNLSGITARDVTADNPATHPSTVNYAQNHDGTLASINVQVGNFESRFAISEEFRDDLVGLDSAITFAMMQAVMESKAENTVAVIKANTAFANHDQSGGALPADKALATWLANAKAQLSVSYQNGAEWIISRELRAALDSGSQSGNGSPLYFDFRMGTEMLLGKPVTTVDYLDSGDNANDVPFLYGNMGRALGNLMRTPLRNQRTSLAVLGNIAYRTNVRARTFAMDTNGLVRGRITS